jgi:hypothetical protein
MADVYRRHACTQNEGASERSDASHARERVRGPGDEVPPTRKEIWHA